MEGVPPSFMDDDVNQWDLQAQEDNFNMSELPSSFNQSSMLCNYQAGQKTLVDNDVIYDSIQQTMMEGAPPSFVDDTLMSELQPSFPQTMTTMGHLDGTSSSWMNQNGPNWQQTPSSEQQWTNELPMSNQVPGMLPQPPMNQCSRQFPYQSNQVPIMHNQYDPQCSTMLPEPSQTLRQEEEAAARIQVYLYSIFH
ncbi:hypothetical protein OIU84_027796 [Salix udensis]|uniref:Uncharacterized protein n=1 Tax=Salix udensis TaxID=889485 RepID=A0AAD6KIA4_9ROSI|nr:hypothetical protein OIU84_027796 [Salix udensis]